MPRKSDTAKKTNEADTGEKKEVGEVMEMEVKIEDVAKDEGNVNETTAKESSEESKADEINEDELINAAAEEKEKISEDKAEPVAEVDMSDDDFEDIEDIEEDIDDESEDKFKPEVRKSFSSVRLSHEATLNTQQKWARLFGFKATHQPVRATIVAAKIMADRAVAECRIDGYDEFNMIVPWEWLDIPTKKELMVKDQRIAIERRIGAKINIVITELNNGIGVGNRVYANYLLRRKYYYRGVRRSLNEEKMIVGKGTIVTATVTGMVTNGIYVEVYGATMKIPIAELSYRNISHPASIYTMGQTVRILITDIEYLNDEGYNIKAKASVKALLKDSTLEALDEAPLYGICLATVVNISYKKGTIMLATALGYNGLATTVIDNRPVKVGSSVTFQLVEKQYNKEKSRGYGIGKILSVLTY